MNLNLLPYARNQGKSLALKAFSLGKQGKNSGIFLSLIRGKKPANQGIFREGKSLIPYGYVFSLSLASLDPSRGKGQAA